MDLSGHLALYFSILHGTGIYEYNDAQITTFRVNGIYALHSLVSYPSLFDKLILIRTKGRGWSQTPDLEMTALLC